MSEVEVRDEGHVRWIVLNRPERMNAITGTMSNAASSIGAITQGRRASLDIIGGARHALVAKRPAKP